MIPSITAVATALTLFLCVHASLADAITDAKTEMKKSEMKALNFQDAKVTDVIDFLVEESRRIDPEGLGFNLVYLPGKKQPTKVAAQPAKVDPFLADLFDLDVQAEPAVHAFDPEARITLRLRRVSMYDALKYITEMANLTFRIDKNVVIIHPKGAGGDIETRFYPIDPSLMQKQIQAVQHAKRQQNNHPFDF